MAKKKEIDWTFIKPLWEEGMPAAEIARQYNAAYAKSRTHRPRAAESSIRAKAAKSKWQRALVSAVMARIKEKLLEGDAEGDPLELTDEQVIERAADKGADVVKLHRQDILKLREMEQKLLDRLAADKSELRVTTYQGDFYDKEYKLGTKERSEILRNLAFVMSKRLLLERQAYGLDEEGGGGEFDKVEVFDG